MGARRGESVLIVSDTTTDRDIAESLFEAARDAGCEAQIIIMAPRTRHGEEPTRVVASAMRSADIILAPTTKSLTHTQARIEACRAGARIASMPGITRPMMVSGGMTADYACIRDEAGRMSRVLRDSRTVRITTQLGTDISFDVMGCRWHEDTGICHEPGCGTNLPAGELYIAPRNAGGTFVVDGSMSGLGILESPLTFIVENRYVVEIRGKCAPELKKMLDAVGKNAYNVAELGIGINPNSALIGNVLEDEKVGGTVHVALGDNSMFGGDIVAGIHLDGIIRAPSVYVDGKRFGLAVA